MPKSYSFLFLVATLAGIFALTSAQSAEQKAKSKAHRKTSKATIGATASNKIVTTPSGLKYIDIKEGIGPSPKTGQQATVHYTGTLKDGTKFDSSVDRGQPFTFVIGIGQVIKGWDEGVATMKVGGKRTLIIPPQLGYGERGAGNLIPPNSELHFDVDLLGVK